MNSEIIYDEFTSPEKINNWVNDKTYKMIPSILDSIPEDFVLGLANAIAIDVDWANDFECTSTRSKEFTKEDGSKIDVSMMHQGDTYAKYFDTEQKYYNYLNKCNLKTLQKELNFQVSINKKEERKDPEYYDTISYNYYG